MSSSPVLAKAPSSCCWSGVKHTGTPVGRVEELGGMTTYITEPSSSAQSTSGPKKVILFLPDVYGPLFVNNQLLQDYFATFGFIVVGPDYFFGNGVPNHPPGFDRQVWVEGARQPAIDAFPAWLAAVKARYGTEETKYSAVGYCFGASFVMDLAASGDIEAGALAHPAFLDESHFEKLNRPLLLSCAEDDFTFPLTSRRRAEDIMVANKSRYYFQVFAGVKHGFAIRGDPNVPRERWAKEESARGIKEWFNWFSSGSPA
ncbi:Alpha/Beta hydrolase protein [Hygrophoropsis aurantiaca]|uniref:Alpha/Beta hydrolase protein n=1 Tax=Hygrophoropsis aurantiaca TaxID=72124 RepID=A0ACB8A8N8_9AGAM|nr:Alpha/Beta hydrolase protein [Hygrophoropsis aurantiaca]